MKTPRLLKHLLFALACLAAVSVTAQDEYYDEYNYGDENQKRGLETFNTDLQETRTYLEYQDDQVMRAKNHKKLDRGLEGFLQTEFMTKYKDLRLDVESLAATFKAHAQNLPPKDVARVRKSYIGLAERFNMFLFDIKKDFLDRKKLKDISRNPEWYGASLELQLRDLKDLYSQDFAKVVADVTGSDEYSATPIMAIFGIIKFAVDFSDYLAKMSYAKKQIKEEYLNEFLIEPYRFKNWEEIETIEGDVFSDGNRGNDDGGDYDDYNDSDSDSFDEMDPFAEDPDESYDSLPAPKKKEKTDKSKGNNKKGNGNNR